MVIEIVNPPANQRKSVGAKIFNLRCKSESTIEPGFDSVLVGRKHVREMVPRERTEMVINDLPGCKLAYRQSRRQRVLNNNRNNEDRSGRCPYPTIMSESQTPP